MDFEEAVMHRLAAEGLFLSPQFAVRSSDGTLWSCPDFVALNFRARQVQVVEVTTASNIQGLASKLQRRQHQWFEPLMPQLMRSGAIDASWTLLARAFVRESNAKLLQTQFKEEHDVLIEAIEDIAFSWKWAWDRLPGAANEHTGGVVPTPPPA